MTDQITLDGLPVVARICECGCTRSLDGRDPRCRFFNAACRRRACRERDAKNIRQAGGRVRAHGRFKPSGLQVSLPKAAPFVAAAIGCPVAEAERILSRALSNRQRQAWEARRA